MSPFIPKVRCKHCDSDNVTTYGLNPETQYFVCKDCGRTFFSAERESMMQQSASTVADSLDMYYRGISPAEIRRNYVQKEQQYISLVSVYDLINRFTDMAVKESGKYKPNVGLVWEADETVIRIDGQKVWFWDIIDSKTHFLLGSHMSLSRTIKDGRALMERACKMAGKYPRFIYTDKLSAYLNWNELTYGAEKKRVFGEPFDVGNDPNHIANFHRIIKQRTEAMQNLWTMPAARKFLDGWLVQYDFFRTQKELGGKTPAREAGVNFPFRKWQDIAEQSYRQTHRTPNKHGTRAEGPAAVRPLTPPAKRRVVKITRITQIVELP